MCEWCGEKTPEERKALIQAAKTFRDSLHRLGDYYVSAAHGREVHHTEASVGRAALAKNIIRQLVGDWI